MPIIFQEFALNLPETPRNESLTDELQKVYAALHFLANETARASGVLVFAASVQEVSERAFVLIASDGAVDLADNSSLSKSAKGVSLGKISQNKFGLVQLVSGPLAGFSGLLPNSIYYLGTSPGSITLAPPSATGTIVQEVGFALSATELFVRIGTAVVNP